jgi:5-methylthioadenosine/S-adenosylhomocysteine deaminase
MQTIDLRLDAGWIVPVEPPGTLSGHAVIVDGGRVAAVVPARAADETYAARAHVTLPGHVLIPGLVNAHTHAAMTLFRGIADDIPLQAWLEHHIWPREARFVAPEFVYDGTRLAAAEMLKGGVTCFNDMYFHPDAAARACLELGIRAMLGLVVLDFPTPYASDPDGYLQLGFAVRDAYKHAPSLCFSLAPHAPYTVNDAAWEQIVMYARQLDLPIQTHVAETVLEVAQSRDLHGATPLARLHRLGATGPGFIAIHAVHLSAADVDLLATHGGHVVHCPISNMKLGSGIAPVTALQARDINVALGTDGAASNNRLDILGEMRVASLLAKVASSDPAVLPAQQALEMATMGGARALGLDARVGSLRPGKEADIVAVDLSAGTALPCYDPVSHLVHVAGRECVTDVWVGGERVVADGALARVDEAALMARAHHWQERLK